MKKIRIYNLIIFAAGLFLLCFGIQLLVKANFGVSAATSMPFVVSQYFKTITFGQWNYIANGAVLLLLVIIVKRLTVKYLMSFFVAFLFGVTLDLLSILLSGIQVDTIAGRIAIFMCGILSMSIGVASLIKSNYPILPFDTFVKEIAYARGITIGKSKTRFDMVCIAISLTSSIILFKEVRGINVGTFAAASVLGTMIGLMGKVINSAIDGKSILPVERATAVMDFDLLRYAKVRKSLEKSA